MLPIITALLPLLLSPSFAEDSVIKVPVPAASPAEADEPPAPKSRLNTDLFEAEEEPQEKSVKGASLTAKVKVVREESDGVEVFFEGEKNTGAFFLHRATPNYRTALKTLEESRKPQGPAVSVTYTEDKKIKSVEKKAATLKEPPKDPNEKWDFSVPGK